jgi:hypothetical protein
VLLRRMDMKEKIAIRPFEGCPALDGYHCQTNSLAKIFGFYGHPISEDMLLGLGAGLGFMYWKTTAGAETSVFIGGRGNNKDFFGDIGRRTGAAIETAYTSSARKAEEELLARLREREPVMLFGDMGFLPWFDFPEGYHFGGHSFVACGFDGERRVLASDMDPKASGLKKGFYQQIPLERLAEARGSPHKPFPPRNARVEFGFGAYRQPKADAIHSAIAQEAEAQLDSPTKNFGIKGMRYAAKELPLWPDMFSGSELRANLFNLYIFIEIGGTGGGCFRYMYARFLREAAVISGRSGLSAAADRIEESGRRFSGIAALFKDAFEADDLEGRMARARPLLLEAADLEEAAFSELSRIVG